jgi:F-type H+-transporting ATPase subunit a
MALDLLTGLVQAYIFAVLAMVFITSAVETGAPAPERRQGTSPSQKDS